MGQCRQELHLPMPIPVRAVYCRWYGTYSVCIAAIYVNMSRSICVFSTLLLGIRIPEVGKRTSESVHEIVCKLLWYGRQTGNKTVAMHISQMKCASEVY